MDDRQLTPEEIEAHRTQMMKFYEDRLPLMRLEAEYAELRAKIPEALCRREFAEAKWIEIELQKQDGAKSKAKDGVPDTGKEGT